MNEPQIEASAEAPAPPKPKRHARGNKRKARAKPSTADKPIAGGIFAGVSATACPSACTPDHCVISTVALCKHPRKTGDGGCGPITLEKRRKVMKLIKHQIIELAE